MSDAVSEESRKPRRRRRWLIPAVASLVALGAVAAFLLRQSHRQVASVDVNRKPPPETKPKKPDTPKISIEYHFDRNAIVDDRLLAARIVALTASGHLLSFDAQSFDLRKEKVLGRRATCLGPSEGGHVLVGISNGCVVRASAEDLAFERVADVPGIPRFIGKKKGDDGLVIAYQVRQGPKQRMVVEDRAQKRSFDVGRPSVLFLDGKDRLWMASAGTVRVLDLASGLEHEVAWKGGSGLVSSFIELSNGDIWVAGGGGKGETASFIAKATLFAVSMLYPTRGKLYGKSAPTAPITHVLEDRVSGRILVVSRDTVFISDEGLGTWSLLDAMAGDVHDDESRVSVGQAHLVHNGVTFALAGGGFLEVTPDYSHRHMLERQNSVSRPSSIVRLGEKIAFYRDGRPLFYSSNT